MTNSSKSKPRTKIKKPSIAHGRPPLTTKYGKSSTPSSSTVTISNQQNLAINPRHKSAKATRRLINTYHQLQKARAVALQHEFSGGAGAGATAGSSGSGRERVEEIDARIEALGGLEAYQAASLTGQDPERGGDSSVKLVEWLRESGVLRGGDGGSARRGHLLSHSHSHSHDHSNGSGLRVLEIGALSSKNAITSAIGYGIQEIKRVDLHSQEPEMIQQIDFMDLPVPLPTRVHEEGFDIVSLSLVLNYVASAAARGEMLLRVTQFLRRAADRSCTASTLTSHSTLDPRSVSTPKSTPTATITPTTPAMTPPNNHNLSTLSHPYLPCLFVVLPLPCLTNSRYMTEPHFDALMLCLGFTLLKRHRTQKLVYMLFKYDFNSGATVLTDTTSTSTSRSSAVATASSSTPSQFRKTEINPGRNRNNFCITLHSP